MSWTKYALELMREGMTEAEATERCRRERLAQERKDSTLEITSNESHELAPDCAVEETV